MHADIAHAQAQTWLRQRNQLAAVSVVALITALTATGYAVTKDRQIVLVPMTRSDVTVSSAQISADYLELVTRDTALMLLNRSPEGLDYWMDEILKLADPSAFGRLKAELVAIVEEQRGSEVSQSFIIRRMDVDPVGLKATVTGTLKTFVGPQVIASDDRRFVFRWRQRGLTLALIAFAQEKSPEQDNLSS